MAACHVFQPRLLKMAGWRTFSSLPRQHGVSRLHSLLPRLDPVYPPVKQPIHSLCLHRHGISVAMRTKGAVSGAVSIGCHRGSRHLHSTMQCSSLINIHELAETLSQHPGMVAVTGTGGIGLLAGLYRSPALWKLIAKASADQSVLLLPQKPSHSFQTRKHDVQKLQALFKSLRKQNRGNVAVAVYVTGRPGFGKTQLAREFGKAYYHRHRGFLFRKLFVGTLNASSKHTFLQSYITLALELGCGSELKALENLSGRKGELQSLELLSAAVRRELRHRPGWLLIVDNLSSDVKSVGGVPALQSTEVLPMVTPSSLPYSPQGIGREGLLEGGGAGGVAAAYGVVNAKAAWSSLWPQPGDEGWGKGCVLVTTHDRRLVERPCPSASELYLSEGMDTKDAVALLEKVSGVKGDGASEVVNSLDKVPLSIARYRMAPGLCIWRVMSARTFRFYLDGEFHVH